MKLSAERCSTTGCDEWAFGDCNVSRCVHCHCHRPAGVREIEMCEVTKSKSKSSFVSRHTKMMIINCVHVMFAGANWNAWIRYATACPKRYYTSKIKRFSTAVAVALEFLFFSHIRSDSNWRNIFISTSLSMWKHSCAKNKYERRCSLLSKSCQQTISFLRRIFPTCETA